MFYWRIVLYAAGTFFALKSLASLMAAHQRNFERSLRRNAKRNRPAEKAGPETGPKESVAA